MTTQVNFDLYQGEAKVFEVQVFSDEAQTIPKDLTGASTLAYKVGDTASGSTMLSLSAIPVDLPNGRINVEFAGVDTSGLQARDWDHQLVAVDAFSHMNVVMAGTLSLGFTLP